MIEVQIAVSKTRKYASSSSGDTVEVIERPNGGVSVVLADGQSSGKGAKYISTMVVRKVITLLAEGVRDGAAARAASDSLFTERNGKVSATLNIISIDKLSRTLVVTRNNPAPTFLLFDDVIHVMDEPCQPVGLYQGTRPSIEQVELKPGLKVIAFSDGVIHAGKRYGKQFDALEFCQQFLENKSYDAQSIADKLLQKAYSYDSNRPADDISVVVVNVAETTSDNIRKMSVNLPLEEY